MVEEDADAAVHLVAILGAVVLGAAGLTADKHRLVDEVLAHTAQVGVHLFDAVEVLAAQVAGVDDLRDFASFGGGGGGVGGVTHRGVAIVGHLVLERWSRKCVFLYVWVDGGQAATKLQAGATSPLRLCELDLLRSEGSSASLRLSIFFKE